MDNQLAPIVLFVYNRPWHTRQTVEALQKNELAGKSELFIYCDEAKNEDARESVSEVGEYIGSVDGFKKVTIIKRANNWGLANSIIDGVTKIVNEYGKIIVLEDDLVTSPYFLRFMNKALEYYKDCEKVMSISGYTYPFKIPIEYKDDTFIFYRSSSWGWATWKISWNNIDFNIHKEHDIFSNKTMQKEFNRGGDDLFNMLNMQMEGKINSWAIRFALGHSLNKSYTLYPCISLVQNIGHDNSGTHCGTSDAWNVLLNSHYIPKLNTIKLYDPLVKNIQKRLNKTPIHRIKVFIRKLIK